MGFVAVPQDTRPARQESRSVPRTGNPGPPEIGKLRAMADKGMSLRSIAT